MTILSPRSVMVVFFSAVFNLTAFSQNCAAPAQLCSEAVPEAISTDDGENLNLPVDFCFTEAPNAVFYQFTTVDPTAYPGADFSDPTASISLGSIICDPDTLLGQLVNVAIFTATNACDESTYTAPIFCDTAISGFANIDLENLEPGTTYYILISSIIGDPPAEQPGLCDITASISGPGVTYDLEADGFPENNPDRPGNILFDGETAVLVANGSFPDLTWTGEALNSTTGSEVTANPEGIDEQFTYTVQTTIDGCIVEDNVILLIFPAIVPYNAFTPNADGFNDTWEIRNINEWPNAQVIVFSRWGQKVFQATNYQNDWNGDDLPAATYYYVIELNPVDFNSEPYTGSVTILR